MKMTLDNIRTYLVPKYRANAGAHRTDSALYVATWICNALDTAITMERKNASIELATIYDMQQKETEIAEQKASLSQQRYLGTVLTLLAVIIGFSLFIYFRHQAALRLESAYRELEVANARAEESSRIKSEFIQQISHEIRTPLNILSGYTQVLTNTDLEIDRDTRHEINRQITENTDRLAGLVSKMLELSDARSKTVIEQNDTLSPVDIAREAVRLSEIEESKHLTFDMMVSQQTAAISLTVRQPNALCRSSLTMLGSLRLPQRHCRQTTRKRLRRNKRWYSPCRLSTTPYSSSWKTQVSVFLRKRLTASSMNLYNWTNTMTERVSD